MDLYLKHILSRIIFVKSFTGVHDIYPQQLENRTTRNFTVCFNKLYIFKMYSSDKEFFKKIPRSTYYIQALVIKGYLTVV